MRHVNKPNVANDLKPSGVRNSGRDFLVFDEHLVGDDARDQEVPAFLRLAKEVEVADMA
jgi:hypothetical protein